jgi:hypothetical protein
MLHRLPSQREMPAQASGPWQEMDVLAAQLLFTPCAHELLPEQLAVQSSPESASSPAQEPVPLQRTMHVPAGQWMRPAQEPGPAQSISQPVAPSHSIPPRQAESAQVTRQGAPAGHATWVWQSPGAQLMTHCPLLQLRGHRAEQSPASPLPPPVPPVSACGPWPPEPSSVMVNRSQSRPQPSAATPPTKAMPMTTAFGI